MFKSLLRYATSNIKPKKYILSQFPYPSGELHLGHARVYYIGDAIANYYKLNGYDVIYPIGWDSFGLPAENAAIINKKNPKEWTVENIQRMKLQLRKLGVRFNWEMELSTCEPEYYRWTQQIFIKMFKKGLAYKQMAQVNWDPVDKTVLANEQVDQNGNSWRSGAKVQKKMLNQWFLKITDSAEVLQKNLDNLEWIQKVKNMQKGWINYKESYNINLPFYTQNGSNKQIKVNFTDISEWSSGQAIIILKVKSSEKRSNGVGYVCNPLNGSIIPVIQVNSQQSLCEQQEIGKYRLKIVQKGNKQQLFQSQSYKNIVKGDIKLLNKTQFNKKVQKINTMKLKDWLISRQRFWGCPIPIVYCKSCGVVPIPEDQLPVLLPQWKNQGNPLIKDDFKRCQCPKCGSLDAQRQSDTMDTFVDSSWYFLRFMDNKNQKEIFSKNNVSRMIPVDVYIGGIEHAIMHLLYARFIMRFIQEEYQLSDNCTEPFKQLVVQGLVKGKTLSLKQNGKYISQAEVDSGQYNINDVKVTYQKMSKSKFNGLNPTNLVQKFGSDALRIAIFFANPPENDIDFSEQIVQNADRFLKRIESLWSNHLVHLSYELNNKNSQLLDTDNLLLLKNIFEKLDISIEKRQMHTYVANTMEMFNFVKSLIESSQNKLANDQKIRLFSVFLRVLQIISPEISRHLISELIKMNPLLFKSQQQFKKWPKDQIFGQMIEIIVMKGKKMIKKDTIQQSWNEDDIIKKLNIKKDEIVELKKQKKRFVMILKE